MYSGPDLSVVGHGRSGDTIDHSTDKGPVPPPPDGGRAGWEADGCPCFFTAVDLRAGAADAGVIADASATTAPAM